MDTLFIWPWAVKMLSEGRRAETITRDKAISHIPTCGVPVMVPSSFPSRRGPAQPRDNVWTEHSDPRWGTCSFSLQRTGGCTGPALPCWWPPPLKTGLTV